MKQEDYVKLLTNASKSTQRLNPDPKTGNPRSVTKLECNPSDASLEKSKVQKATGGRFYVSVTAFRRRLLDEDNLCEKYVCDLCRYAGALPDDNPEQTQIEVSQQKVKKGEPERVAVEVWRIS